MVEWTVRVRTPERSRRSRRWDKVVVLTPSADRPSSLKPRGPAISRWTMKSVHFSWSRKNAPNNRRRAGSPQPAFWMRWS
jgi:hypothetical protein